MHSAKRAGHWDSGARVMLLEEDPAGHQRSGGSLIVEVGLVFSYMWASTVATKLLSVHLTSSAQSHVFPIRQLSPR